MWLAIPESCLSSPAVEVSTSPSSSLCQGLARSALWRGTSRPPEFWERAWKRAIWLRRLSGLTLLPSEADAGVERWISSWADSPAPTSPSPDQGPGSTARSPGSGESSLGSLARWDPDSYSWRTSQLSLLEASTAYSGTFSRSGTMRNGRLFRREPVVHLTGGTGSSSWVTPAARDRKNANGPDHERHDGQLPNQLPNQVAQWPTPIVGEGGSGRRSGDRSGEMLLGAMARAWPTPAASSYGRNKGGANPDGPERPSLDTLARTWPTPRASPNENRTTKRAPSHGKTHGRVLAGEACEAVRETWPTPTSGDAKASGAAGYSTESGRHEGTALTDATCRSGPPAPETQPGETAPTLALNPRFVETLMGWPDGWTDCESSGMVSSRFRERWRSYLFSIVSGAVE